MTTFVIRNSSGDDLGFILFAKHEGEWPPPGTSDCVFMPFPSPFVVHPAAALIFENKGMEHKAEISYTDTTMTVRIPMRNQWVFDLRSSDDGNFWIMSDGYTSYTGGGDFI